MGKPTDINDDELDALMAELDAVNAGLAASKPAEPKPEPAAEQQPVFGAEDKPEAYVQLPKAAVGVVLTAEPEPEVEPEPEPKPEIIESEPEPKSLAGQHEAPRQPEPAFSESELAESVAIAEQVAAAAPPPSKKPAPEMRATPEPSPNAPGLNFYVDPSTFARDTRVSLEHLDACMIEQSGLRAYYAAQAANAEAQAARVKARYEVLEARLYDEHRKSLALLMDKVTEKAVENAVKLDPKWLKGKNLVIEAESIAAVNKGLVMSIGDRRDMIIQLGADRRDEFKGAARVVAAQNEREDMVSRAQAAGRRSINGG